MWCYLDITQRLLMLLLINGKNLLGMHCIYDIPQQWLWVLPIHAWNALQWNMFFFSSEVSANKLLQRANYELFGIFILIIMNYGDDYEHKTKYWIRLWAMWNIGSGIWVLNVHDEELRKRLYSFSWRHIQNLNIRFWRDNTSSSKMV